MSDGSVSRTSEFEMSDDSVSEISESEISDDCVSKIHSKVPSKFSDMLFTRVNGLPVFRLSRSCSFWRN